MAELRVIDRREVDFETALGALTNFLKNFLPTHKAVLASLAGFFAR